MNKTFALLLTSALCIALASTLFARTGVQTLNENTRIDWTNHVYIATGEGAMPTAKEEPNRARAYLKAKTYARMAAVANLIMAAEGTSIDYNSGGKDFMADENVQQKIKGLVKTVEVIDTRKEQVEGGTIVVVKVKAPMPAEPKAKTASAKKAMPKAAKVTAAVAPAKPAVKMAMLPDSKPWEDPAADPDAYTSLIIDARGMDLERCMSPKIRTRDGREVWGTVKVNYDFLQDHGMVAYATSLSDARNNERCGANPLVIDAVGRAGGRFHSDPVISYNDADLILAENARGKFLDNFCVVFVKD